MKVMTTYWEKRIEKLNNETYKDADKYVRELRKLYEQEINNIEEKIYNHLSKLQEEAGGISLFDAKKLLNDKELDLFKMGLEDFMKKSKGNISPELERELNIISRRVRISRLQAMEVELKKTVAGLMSREERVSLHIWEGPMKEDITRNFTNFKELLAMTALEKYPKKI